MSTRSTGPGLRAARLSALRIASWIALWTAVGAAPALAQDASPPVPDVPSGPAVLRGRVLHAERPDAVGGVSIVLYALDASGQPGSRRGETAADGRFAFEGISNEPNVVYLIGARYAGLPFPGDRVVFEAGQLEASIEVELFEPSDDLARVRVLQSSVRLSLGNGRLVVAEVHRLSNDGRRVFHVSPERRAAGRAPLEVELLPGVENFAMPLGVVPEGATRDGSDFRFWGPLYPGEQEISFRYEVPVETGVQTLAKRFPSAAERIRVFGSEGGPLEAVEGLEPGAMIEESGLRFRPFEVTAPGAGFVARLALRIPEMRADPGAVRLVEGQAVLEVDDVTLQAQEQYRLEVDGSAVVRAEPGELLLNLTLPEGAEDIRFSADANALGLVRSDEGVGIVGPLEPGSHGLGLAYTLRSGPDGVRVERRYDRRLPLLRVFVADTGVAVASERLHRRRPVRDADRTYLIFEAFEIDASDTLDLSLSALPPRGSSTGPALALAIAAGLASLAFLIAPLRGASDDDAALADDDATPAARDEREHLYESIRDLDHDYETGKIDEEGWTALRAELRGRAVALLAEERGRAATSEASPAEASPAEASPAAASGSGCTTCGAEPRPGDRFCSGCGAPLEGGPA